VELKVNGLDNRNYTLPIKNLLEEIDVGKSHWKVKTGIMCHLSIKQESKFYFLTPSVGEKNY
jgi:hypothetical protein